MNEQDLVNEIARSKWPGQLVGKFNGISVYVSDFVPKDEIQFWSGESHMTLKNVGDTE
uniref:Uncharacterized protein n=1 Tax=viral metagenome TaxID=1070528 RepID=A0A6H1ZU58_9ZZZZ